jgi:uncharacterized protein YceK
MLPLMIRSRRWQATLVVLAVAMTVAGCGSVDQRADAAAGAATRLLTAIAAHDGTTACALLAPDTASELAEAQGSPCAEAILQQDLPAPGPVTASAVYGQWAQVRLSGDTMFLAVFRCDWRVVAAGCTPRNDRPYDCTLQGS